MNSNRSGLRVSAIIATKGRSDELRTLFESLEVQRKHIYEIIVVDQNHDDRLVEIINSYDFMNILHIHDPNLVGVNASRNAGWQRASGDVVFFPDDDCWYPPNFVKNALSIFYKKGPDIVSGRAADEQEKSINGKFLKNSGWVTRKSAWFTQIEWVFFVRRELLELVGGWDESLGPGAGTMWGANEVQDLSLRALSAGFKQYFNSELFGHHEEFSVLKLDKEAKSKTIAYARGFGYVLAKHRFGLLEIALWSIRPCVGAFLLVVRGQYKLSWYSLYTMYGRISGYISYFLIDR